MPTSTTTSTTSRMSSSPPGSAWRGATPRTTLTSSDSIKFGATISDGMTPCCLASSCSSASRVSARGGRGRSTCARSLLRVLSLCNARSALAER
eukprot:726222-Pyramimonas_sp.AAC.1